MYTGSEDILATPADAAHLKNVVPAIEELIIMDGHNHNSVTDVSDPDWYLSLFEKIDNYNGNKVIPLTHCEDTPNWTNGVGPAEQKCINYAVHWCKNRGPMEGMAWALGPVFNHPEQNCCSCGKPRTPWVPKPPAPPTDPTPTVIIKEEPKDDNVFVSVNKVARKVSDDIAVAIVAIWPFNMWFVVLPFAVNLMVTVEQFSGIATHKTFSKTLSLYKAFGALNEG
jgi:hypothetical protein